MAAYAAAQKPVTISVGSGDVTIRWVGRIPVMPVAVPVRQVAPVPPSQSYPPGTRARPTALTPGQAEYYKPVPRRTR